MRLPDWHDRFIEYIDAARGKAFTWGSHDCCSFGARCIDAITGSALAKQLATKYSDADSARAYIASFGSLEAAVSSWLGPSKAPNFAGPGDLVLALDTVTGQTVGICLGADCMFVGPLAPYFSNRSAIQACWTV